LTQCRSNSQQQQFTRQESDQSRWSRFLSNFTGLRQGVTALRRASPFSYPVEVVADISRSIEIRRTWPRADHASPSGGGIGILTSATSEIAVAADRRSGPSQSLDPSAQYLRVNPSHPCGHTLCTMRIAPMKRSQLVRKPDRRDHDDRRVRSRSGRRQGDPSAVTKCPSCESRHLEVTGVTHGVTEYRCRSCRDTWVVLRRKRES
jgi:hypothetical protein